MTNVNRRDWLGDKSTDLREIERPATWTTKLREMFHDEAALARQEDITAQEEMRFGERKS